MDEKWLCLRSWDRPEVVACEEKSLVWGQAGEGGHPAHLHECAMGWVPGRKSIWFPDLATFLFLKPWLCSGGVLVMFLPVLPLWGCVRGDRVIVGCTAPARAGAGEVLPCCG